MALFSPGNQTSAGKAIQRPADPVSVNCDQARLVGKETRIRGVADGKPLSFAEMHRSTDNLINSGIRVRLDSYLTGLMLPAGDEAKVLINP